MLLNAINVTNSRGSVLSLPLEDISTGFVVKEVEGLDPVKATLVSSSFANMDGEQYHTSRREARNIKIKLGLEPDWAAEDVKNLRDQLYDFFMPKTKALLGFHMFDVHATNILEQTLDAQIEGRIESFDSAMFTDEPEVDISLMCFDPDFYNPTEVIFDGMSVSDLTETVLPYTGSVETGATFTLLVNRDLPAFTIYHRPADETLRTLDFSYPLLAGDVLQISSVFGSKFVKLTRAGVESSVLWAMSPQSSWLELQPGDNNIRVYAGGAPVPYTIGYLTKYGGL